jgi:hypothetical protein
MKHFLIATFFLMTLVSGLCAQSFTLSDSLGPIQNNYTKAINGEPGDDYLKTYAFVTNNSNLTLDVKVKKVEFIMVPGTMSTFCWGSCYPPNIFVSFDSIPIGPGQTNYFDFTGEYYPSMTTGSSLIRYVFFDKDNPADTVCFNTKFCTEVPAAITTVEPDSLQREQTATLQISGSNTHFGFWQTAQVCLSHSGEIILPGALNVVNDNLLQATFTIPAGATLGLWDVNVYDLFDGNLSKPDAVTVYILIGTGDKVAEDAFNVYPNPVTDRLFVSLDRPGVMTTLKLLNTAGQAMLETDVYDRQACLDLGDLPRGVYLLQVTNAQGSRLAKVVRY